MKLIYTTLVATTAAAIIIVVASVGVTRPKSTTPVTTSTASTSRPGRPQPGSIPMPTLKALPTQLVITANVGGSVVVVAG